MVVAHDSYMFADSNDVLDCAFAADGGSLESRTGGSSSSLDAHGRDAEHARTHGTTFDLPASNHLASECDEPAGILRAAMWCVLGWLLPGCMFVCMPALSMAHARVARGSSRRKAIIIAVFNESPAIVSGVLDSTLQTWPSPRSLRPLRLI